MIRTPRLVSNRFGVFAIRVLIPAKQSGTGVRKELRHSLGTKNPAIARVLALQFNLHFEQARLMPKINIHELTQKLISPYKLDLAQGVMEATSASDHARMMEALAAMKDVNRSQPASAGYAVPQNTAPVLPSSLPWFKATQLYLSEKRHDNTQKTLDEKKGVYAEFHDKFGNLDLNQIPKDKMRQWKAWDDGKANFTARRINKRLSFFSDFFNWAINNGHYHHPANPCDGLRISTRSKLVAKGDSYLPFSDNDLAKIFGEGYAEFMNKPHHYWLPFMGLFTGTRIEELASLTPSQIQEIDGVWCFVIYKGKTRASRRNLPIHPALLEGGFKAYFEQVQANGAAMLFPDLKDSKNGFSKNTSRRFGEWLDKIGISDPLKVFHSFRHTVITRLHSKRANPAHVMQISAHASSGASGVHFTVYTHAFSPVDLLETVKLLDYPMIQIQPLNP
jgi:integrase